MQSIRDVAVFAWALTGINGTLEAFAHGKPAGESQPPDGFPVWEHDSTGFYGNGLGSGKRVDSMSNGTASVGISASAWDGNGNGNGNGHGSGRNGNGGSRRDPFGDPGLSNA
jgi:hypothetical protein